MRYLALILFVIFFVQVHCSAQMRYAVLIGIGNYPIDSGWNQIHGNNDVNLIKDYLLTQGFSPSSIMELTDVAATKDNILHLLSLLSSKASSGDICYIHFSGHGQQVTDLDGDEEDGFDEAWIPYDAKKYYEEGVYEGTKHLIDDDINLFLAGLRTKVGATGRIIVTADACHSGSSTRGIQEGELSQRGTADKFIIPKVRSNIVRKDASVYWLFVGACKPYQTNYEILSQDGNYYGSLSYVIAKGGVDATSLDFQTVIDLWRSSLIELSRYPQDLDEEGQPSRRSKKMF